MTDESEIKRAICELLERFPDRILFTISPPKRTKYNSKFMKVGWPDIFGCMRTQVETKTWQPPFRMDACLPFFIEVKKSDGKLSLEQHKILEQAKAMGAITCVATDVNDVRRALGL